MPLLIVIACQLWMVGLFSAAVFLRGLRTGMEDLGAGLLGVVVCWPLAYWLWGVAEKMNARNRPPTA